MNRIMEFNELQSLVNAANPEKVLLRPIIGLSRRAIVVEKYSCTWYYLCLDGCTTHTVLYWLAEWLIKIIIGDWCCTKFCTHIKNWRAFVIKCHLPHPHPPPPQILYSSTPLHIFGGQYRLVSTHPTERHLSIHSPASKRTLPHTWLHNCIAKISTHHCSRLPPKIERAQWSSIALFAVVLGKSQLDQFQ